MDQKQLKQLKIELDKKREKVEKLIAKHPELVALFADESFDLEKGISYSFDHQIDFLNRQVSLLRKLGFNQEQLDKKVKTIIKIFVHPFEDIYLNNERLDPIYKKNYLSLGGKK